jgi:hypothetical protein
LRLLLHNLSDLISFFLLIMLERLYRILGLLNDNLLLSIHLFMMSRLRLFLMLFLSNRLNLCSLFVVLLSLHFLHNLIMEFD